MTQSSQPPTRQFRGKLTRRTLLQLLPLTILTVAALGIITLYNTGNFLREQIINQFSSVSNTLAGQTEQLVAEKRAFFDEVRNDTLFDQSLDNVLNSDPSDPNWELAKDQLLLDYERLSSTQSQRHFDDFVVVGPDEKILISTNANWEGKQLDHDTYQELLTKPASVLFYNMNPFNDPDSNPLLLFTSQQIIDSFGNYKATVIGITDSPALQRILEAGTLSHPQARPYFISRSSRGEVYVGLSPATGKPTAFSPSDGHIETVLPKVLNKERENVVEFASFNNVSVLGFVKWLTSIDSALVLEVPQTVISIPLQDSATLQITLLIIALIILGILIWLGTQRIVRPIAAVSLTAQHFADGDMQARAIVDRDDEIGQLAYSFNYVADQLVALYRSMESTIDARTQQVQTAAEVAQVVTSASSLDEMLSHTVNLITNRFNYYHTAIYLMDRGGDYIVLREAAGQAAEDYLSQGLQIEVGSRSIVGTVSATDKPWIADDVKQDPYYLELESLPGTQSEAVIPLSVGGRVLGVLDVQSNELKAFDDQDVITLQTLASQIASAIQNVRLLENTQIDLQSANLLYQISHELADANTIDDVFRVLGEILRGVPYNSAIFTLEANKLQSFEITSDSGSHQKLDASIPISQIEINTIVSRYAWMVIQTDNPPDTLIEKLSNLAAEIGCQAFVLIPLKSGERFLGLTLLGTDDENRLTPASLEPYNSIAEMTNTALEKIIAVEGITASFAELQSLSTISQAISTETELENLFGILHRQLTQAIGGVDFLIALYDAETELVEIPYMTEDDQIVSIPAFHLGQGLTSIVIRTRQPLMLIEDTVNRAKSLGAFITDDKPALSWLGVPMQIGGEVVGAIVVQDTEQEHRFDEDDLRLLTTLAGQVAPIVRNARLLAEAQDAAERDRQLYRITNKIRRGTSIQAILETTTQELSQILDLRKAKIEILVDTTTVDGKRNGTEEKSE